MDPEESSGLIPKVKLKKASLDLLFLKRFLFILRQMNDKIVLIPYFMLMVIGCLVEIVIWKVGKLLSGYQSILIHRDFDSFLNLTIYGLILLIIGAIVKSSFHVTGAYFQIKTRQIITTQLHARKPYLNNNTLDNPDQR